LLAAGATVSYTCTLKQLTSFTNVISAGGLATTGDAVTVGAALRVTGSGAALQPIALRAAVSVAVKPIGRAAKAPRFEITVTNTGKVALHDVMVSARRATSCNHRFAMIRAGKREAYACSPRPGTTGGLSSITVVGTSPTGLKVTAGGTATRA
jgi:hypothetical protein